MLCAVLNMRLLIDLTVIIFALFGGFDCQIHYVPAQILIPTVNGTHIAINPTVNHTNSYAPPFVGYNRPSYTNNNTSTSNNTYNGTNDGHLIIGNIQPFDRLLFNQEYFKPGRWWSDREKIVEYPKDLPAGYSRHETISALRVYNKFYQGNTAKATVKSGGIGRQYVKIKLESTWGKGFRYSVQIFGH